MKKFILSVTVFCLLLSCKDNDNVIEINDTNCQAQVTETKFPQWLDLKKAELQKDDFKGAQIDLLTYSWGTAIFINPCTQCADLYTYIYDNCGVQICETGGIAGTTTCTGKYLENSQRTLLWKE